LACATQEEVVRCKTVQPSLTITMLTWSVTFLIIAIVAAAFGFGGIAGTAVGIAKLLFFVFLVLFILSVIFGRRTPRA